MESLPHLGMSMCSVSAQFRCQILICTVEGVCGSIEHACVAVVVHAQYRMCSVIAVQGCVMQVLGVLILFQGT